MLDVLLAFAGNHSGGPNGLDDGLDSLLRPRKQRCAAVGDGLAAPLAERGIPDLDGVHLELPVGLVGESDLLVGALLDCNCLINLIF